MQIDEYQAEAHKFAKYGSNFYPFLGLAEEAGEVCGKLAKFVRKHIGRFPERSDNLEYAVNMDIVPNCEANDDARFNEELKKELGDVMWMVAECATIFGILLDDITTDNIDKLKERMGTGTINGSGDTNSERLANKYFQERESAICDLSNAKFHINRLLAIVDESIERDGYTHPESVSARTFLEGLK